MLGSCEQCNWILGFHKIQEISRLAEGILESLEGFHPVELVNEDEDNWSLCEDRDNGCGSTVVSVIFSQTTLYHIQANENLCE